MEHNPPKYGIRTRAVHAGEGPDPNTGASAPNLVMSTTFVVDADAPFSAENFSEDTPYLYTRWANPTVTQLEQKLADLERGEATVAFGSGMAAVTALLMNRLKPGDHLVISDVAYAGAVEFVNDTMAAMGIKVTRVNMTDLDQVADALSSPTKLVFAETPCNPILRLTDIQAVADLAHQAGAELAVDSTFATPIATRPIALGADYVVHSLTKYLGGHGDALGGAVIGPAERMNALRQHALIHLGGVISPFNAWLIMRGIATLPLRMRAHADNAIQIAVFLDDHPKVKQVNYPGLPSHPQFELAHRQMDNFSGMMAVQIENGPEVAKQLSRRLQVWHYATSLGHQRSLMFYIPTADILKTSFKLEGRQLENYRAYAGDGIFRLSVGIEDPEDLCADLEQALDF